MIRADVGRLLAVAESQIGYSESPPHSNRTKYGAWYGMNGVAWCAIWVSWVFAHAGSPLPRMASSKGFAYVPDVRAYAQRHGQWRSAASRPQPGWLVLFSFGGVRPDHVGIVVRRLADGRVETIEGNTNGAGSRTGGSVLRKYRGARIVGYVAVANVGARPQPEPSPLPEVESPSEEEAMFLAVDNVGLFAVVNGVPIVFASLAEFGRAKEASEGVPMVWMPEGAGRQMVAELLKKHAALLGQS